MDDHNEERTGEAYDEAGLSDDEFEEQSFDDLLDRVESNDPSLTSVKISTLNTISLPNNNTLQHRLERLGTAIGRNTQLNALMIDGHELISEEQINAAQAVHLFLGIACNQSIRRLHFEHCGEILGNVCRILTLLFKTNQVERISIDDCELSHEDIRLLTTSLLEFDSLKEFALTDVSMVDHDPQVARELVQSLSGHSHLRKLDLSDTDVGKLCCSAFADDLLSNPSTNLRVLDLSSNNLDDTEADALSSGMAGNVSLEEINLYCNSDITQAGWQAIFDALSNSSCMLRKLSLSNNGINDAAAQSLSNALTSNRTLKTLDLAAIWGITLIGWRVLFGALRSPTCVLEDLDLRNNQLNDDVMDYLTDALASNKSLKSLKLNNTDGVTGATWQIFFYTVLTNPSSGLQKLNLGGCGNINNAAILALTDALVNNSKLKVINLNNTNDNDLITSTGWGMLSSVLESPHTALEELHLAGHDINDATLTLLINSLAGNKILKEMYFWRSDDWDPPQSVLCNAASILDTFNSNHTLEKLCWEDEGLPEDFVSLLQINRENSPCQAAWLKIIKTHFKEGFNTHPFVDMDLNLLPHAMTWMIRDSVNEVNGRFYSFIRSISSLFENVHAHDRRNKRKRCE